MLSHKKLPLNIRKFEQKFIDNDISEHQEELDSYISATTNSNVSTLDKFLSRPEFIASEHDERTNIFIPGKARYCIPESNIATFFLLLEQVRRDGISLIFAEKQEEKSSGILIDVDIFYKAHVTESKIDYSLLHSIVSGLMKVIEDIFDLTPLKQLTPKIQIAITKRPKPVTREHNGQTIMSEGFHILIPAIKISRASKHFLIKRLMSTCIIDKRVEQLKEYLIDEKYNYVDEASRYVPVFFVGCKRDPKKTPYELFAVFDYQFATELNDYPNISENRELSDRNPNCVVVYEFSLNYEVPNGYIKKIHVLPNMKYAGEIEAYSHSNRPQDIEEELKLSGSMSLSKLNDPEFEFIKSLLDILHPARAQDHDPWLEVMMILSNIGERVKSLAEYFSRKCPEKFRQMGMAGFESLWLNLTTKAKTLPPGKKKGLGTLIWLAKADNPKRYEEVVKRNILKTINTIAYKRSVSGEFEHADIAEVLYQMFGNKYATDRVNGEKKLSWFEFITPGDNMKKGEVFKYHMDTSPRSLERYISEVLVQIFERIHDDMHESRHNLKDVKSKAHTVPSSGASVNGDAASIMTDTEFERLQARKDEIRKGLLRTIKNLKKDNFINSTINRCLVKFEKRGFADQLDQDDNIMGVGNGVLLFHESGKVELLQTQHDYKISLFTPVDYVPFDPKKPHTKHLLKAIRSMVKDDEPDTFEFLMCALASALTGFKKEAFLIFLLGTGREGKSTLMQLWRAVLGQYGRKLPIALLVGMRAKGESANPAMMDMENKRGVSYQEPGQTDKLNAPVAKENTGGEKATGRGLFQSQREFEPKCVHLIPTNYLVDITDTDDAIWRRIKVIRLQIKFFNKNDTKYNPNDPYHRLADPQADRFDKDPEYLSAFLSILVYYWQVFQIKYGGKLVNIPHPHIEYETAKYRTAKDSIDEFITRRMVRVPDRQMGVGQKGPHIERMKAIIDKYVQWMDSQAKWCAKSLIESSIENSKIGKMLDQDRVSKYLKGFRFLGPTEPKQDDESYVYDVTFNELLGDEYETKNWKEERESLNKGDKVADLTALLEQPLKNFSESDKKSSVSGEDVKVAPPPDEKTKAELIDNAIKSNILSDAAKAALASEKKLKTVKPESIEEFYTRICAEYDSNDMLQKIEGKAKQLDDTEKQFVDELMTYERNSRRNEMKATTESYKQFQMAEKEKRRNILENISAPSRIVEMSAINTEIYNVSSLSNDLDGVIRLANESDMRLLDMDEEFVFPDIPDKP